MAKRNSFSSNAVLLTANGTQVFATKAPKTEGQPKATILKDAAGNVHTEASRLEIHTLEDANRFAALYQNISEPDYTQYFNSDGPCSKDAVNGMDADSLMRHLLVYHSAVARKIAAAKDEMERAEYQKVLDIISEFDLMAQETIKIQLRKEHLNTLMQTGTAEDKEYAKSQLAKLEQPTQTAVAPSQKQGSKKEKQTA